MNIANRSAETPGAPAATPDRNTGPTAELVRLAQAGDVAAFERLVALQYSFIFKTAYRWLGHRSDAEDVTQTVCMRLANGLKSFDWRASFTSWLYRITLNAVHDVQRSNQRRQRLESEMSFEINDASPPTQEDQLALNALWQVVRELPDKQRDAVLLVYGEHMSHAEAAKIMGCKDVTVAWHIHNARKALKDRL
ncbi:sigma-70 family RNA polymerase sigma factor [Aureimonas fodinaquatilis]|uniref:Sigma-70 family RNA polymerase sigma factor n=1 Tax=Aureimonas fodinaquatilis TaxID=2565783 RepID=A0A5B0DYU4_9HYPH|nr:sigma-70 family RNA polymerase sigma factor [Aureimonas fodinaquatilis]KAA0971964.1 sigma-70 family RNA polymerase sigma factor [Aureimonas fodinaquatilis]